MSVSNDPKFRNSNLIKACEIYGCTDNIWQLSDILNGTLYSTINGTNDKIGEIMYSCYANIIAGGRISYIDNVTSFVVNSTIVKLPLVYIQCKNKDLLNDPKVHEIMTELIPNITQLMQFAGMTNGAPLVSRDPFVLGVLMICFAQICICVAYWMLFIMVILLPSDNHNRQNRFVLFYVLVSAIFETITLKKSAYVVFRPQYYDNYQNSDEYEHVITNSSETRALELVCSVLAHLNWLICILYMYPNPNWTWLQKNKKIPKFLRKGRTVMLILGLLLIAVDDSLFGTFLGDRDNAALRLGYKVFEIILYTIFATLIIYFMLSNFAFVLSPKAQEASEAHRRHSEDRCSNECETDDDNSLYFTFGRNHKYRFSKWWRSIKSRFTKTVSKCSVKLYYQLKVIWAEYQDIIPLLIYNTVLFFLSYWATIFLNTGKYYYRRWAYNVVYFLRALITVNVWALIGVLEKKELIVSKNTVLGRQINSVSFENNEDSDTIFGSIKEVDNNLLSKNNFNMDNTRTILRLENESLENGETQYYSDDTSGYSTLEQPTASSKSPIRRLRYFRKRKKL